MNPTRIRLHGVKTFEDLDLEFPAGCVYHRTGDGERRVDHCGSCDWPPGTPMSPQEWREHPANPLNARSSDSEDKA